MNAHTVLPTIRFGCGLHDRPFMSKAGRTRYFARSATWARSARLGKEKKIIMFFSFPRLALRARVALRAKYGVRPAWLIKRLSCRLIWLGIDCHVTKFIFVFTEIFDKDFPFGLSPPIFFFLGCAWSRTRVEIASWVSYRNGEVGAGGGAGAKFGAIICMEALIL